MNEYRERDIEQRQCFYTSPIHLLTHHHNNLTKKAGGRGGLTCLLRHGKQTLLCRRAVISLGTITKVSRLLKINQAILLHLKDNSNNAGSSHTDNHDLVTLYSDEELRPTEDVLDVQTRSGHLRSLEKCQGVRDTASTGLHVKQDT